MSRTIKFRAWVKEPHNCMHYSDYAGFESLNDWVKRYGGELMEWTGLLDKNGKEIYEGDIVEFSAVLDDKKKGRAKVFFNDGCFIANGIMPGPSPLKVIGNIYENPNLLGENQ